MQNFFAVSHDCLIRDAFNEGVSDVAVFFHRKYRRVFDFYRAKGFRGRLRIVIRSYVTENEETANEVMRFCPTHFHDVLREMRLRLCIEIRFVLITCVFLIQGIEFRKSTYGGNFDLIIVYCCLVFSLQCMYEKRFIRIIIESNCILI